MHRNDIPIHPGFGCSPQKPEEFMASYPFWPTIWGIPGFTNRVSLRQGSGFNDLSFES